MKYHHFLVTTLEANDWLYLLGHIAIGEWTMPYSHAWIWYHSVKYLYRKGFIGLRRSYNNTEVYEKKMFMKKKITYL